MPQYLDILPKGNALMLVHLLRRQRPVTGDGISYRVKTCPHIELPCLLSKISSDHPLMIPDACCTVTAPCHSTRASGEGTRGPAADLFAYCAARRDGQVGMDPLLPGAASMAGIAGCRYQILRSSHVLRTI